MSLARASLQQVRRQRFIPSNAPVSREEHDYAVSVERTKLQEFQRFTTNNNNNDILMEPTMVERVAFPVIPDVGITARVSTNKRSATVTPCPEEARGRCLTCHVPIEFGNAYCRLCFRQSPEGRAKRAKIGVVANDEMGDHHQVDMNLD